MGGLHHKDNKSDLEEKPKKKKDRSHRSSKINDIELQRDDSMQIKLNKSILPPITPPTKYERLNRRSFIDIDETAKTESYLDNP